MQYLDRVLPTLLSILQVIFSVMQFKQGQRMEQYEKSQKIYDDARLKREWNMEVFLLIPNNRLCQSSGDKGYQIWD